MVIVALGTHAAPAEALERLCDSSVEDCRREILDRIRAEGVEISVAAWFFEDARFTNELIARWQAGVRVRVLGDPRANPQHPLNATLLSQLSAAGIPIRSKVSSGIEHWKMMLFAGQGVVYFGSANFSEDATMPNQPYVDYVDETIYLTDDPSVVGSFKTKFDHAWVDTTNYGNYANAPNASVARHYPVYALDPELNWAPASGSASYRSRSVAAYRAETQRIDIIMYRITDQAHVDALIAAHRRGVPVRIYHEQAMYRDASQLWHSMSIDKLFAAGIPVRERAHAGLNHQKLVLLYGQQMTIFGSSNMTSKSSDSQHEHNYFTRKPHLFAWFAGQFERKWNNTIGIAETAPFVPQPPDKPEYRTPADGAVGVPATAVDLVWYGGPWAHLYDIYFGTTPNPPLLASAQPLGPSETTTQRQSYRLPRLTSGTTYYWRVVSRTMANAERAGEVRSFTTAGPPRGPISFSGGGASDIVVFRPSTGEWFIRQSSTNFAGTASFQWGLPGDVPLSADFDGDRRSDLAVFRPADGGWYIRYSSVGYAMSQWAYFQWGLPGDIPLSADFDGDGRTDLTVFRPADGGWYIRRSSVGYAMNQWTYFQWGLATDIPLSADVDGDGKTDLVVYRPSEGGWYVRSSSSHYTRNQYYQWGLPGDIPLVTDFDGDGRADLSVFRPADGGWYIRYSSVGYAINRWVYFQWGLPTDIPLSADFDGDARTDLTVFRPADGVWYIRFSSKGYAGDQFAFYQWGLPGDAPLKR